MQGGEPRGETPMTAAKSPKIVTIAHDHEAKPQTVGYREMERIRKRLESRGLRFYDADPDPLRITVYRMTRGGYLGSLSEIAKIRPNRLECCHLIRTIFVTEGWKQWENVRSATIAGGGLGNGSDSPDGPRRWTAEDIKDLIDWSEIEIFRLKKEAIEEVQLAAWPHAIKLLEEAREEVVSEAKRYLDLNASEFKGAKLPDLERAKLKKNDRNVKLMQKLTKECHQLYNQFVEEGKHYKNAELLHNSKGKVSGFVPPDIMREHVERMRSLPPLSVFRGRRQQALTRLMEKLVQAGQQHPIIWRLYKEEFPHHWSHDRWSQEVVDVLTRTYDANVSLMDEFPKLAKPGNADASPDTGMSLETDAPDDDGMSTADGMTLERDIFPEDDEPTDEDKKIREALLEQTERVWDFPPLIKRAMADPEGLYIPENSIAHAAVLEEAGIKRMTTVDYLQIGVAIAYLPILAQSLGYLVVVSNPIGWAIYVADVVISLLHILQEYLEFRRKQEGFEAVLNPTLALSGEPDWFATAFMIGLDLLAFIK